MMTKRSLYVFLLGSAVMVLPMVASAQSVAELKPTGQWLVNSAGMQGLAQAGNVHAPCIMANQYNNGFILRIAGGGQQLMSLSLDFRQNAFAPGETYTATLSVDGGRSHTLTATAFSPAILIIGVREAQGLYQEMQVGRSLALNVVGNTIIFSLERVAEGFQRLESCVSPPTQTSQPAQAIAAIAPQPIPTKPDTEVYVKRGEYPEFKQPTSQDILKAGKDTSEPSLTVVNEPVATAASTSEALAGLPPLSAKDLADLNLTEEDIAPYNGKGMKVATAPKVPPVETPVAPSVPKVEAEPIDAPKVPGVAKVEPVALTPIKSPSVPDAPQPKPVEAAKPLAVAAVTPRSSAAGAVPRGPSSTAQGSAKTAPATWTAQAGEDMRAVLARWADTAGADLVWEADGGGKVAQDIAVTGTFEEAVAQVMADNAAAMGISGQFAEGDRMVPVEAVANRAPARLTSGAGGANGALQAQAGDDLKDIMQAWAADNNVDLRWQADRPFTLKEPVQASGDFTAAIEAALGQFDDQSVRPVGQLNRDPKTGRMSLTIETDRAS